MAIFLPFLMLYVTMTWLSFVVDLNMLIPKTQVLLMQSLIVCALWPLKSYTVSFPVYV